ncbi:MAG: PD-(D/E)XK nuclease family protein [Gemmatimonadetes bacterium]|nr:PD-(D/E)XK nuclease family protein [Gemmatimonadota bacterium]
MRTAAQAGGLLTHSRLSSFRACPRRHWMRYELGLAPERDGLALRVGSAFHLALDALAGGGDPAPALEESLDDPYDLALVAAMVTVHTERWAREPFDIVASELAFDLPLVNPATGRPSTVWRIAGVIDAIAELPDGRLALVERKTTSRDFSPGSEYWLQLHMDPQLSVYVLAARQLGYAIDTILYDVTRRPRMRPRRATPEEKRRYKANGDLYANQRAEDEAPEAFAVRVAAAMRARPDYHFARAEIARLDQDLADCAAELWAQQKTLRLAQRTGRWYRNPGSCYAPFPCAYLSVCQFRDLEDVTPNGFIRLEDVHPELPEVSSAYPAGG